PITEAVLNDKNASKLAAKVALSVDPAYDARFPAEIATRVEIKTAEKTFRDETTYPKGEATNPMTWDDLSSKYFQIAQKFLDDDAARTLYGAISAVADGAVLP